MKTKSKPKPAGARKIRIVDDGTEWPVTVTFQLPMSVLSRLSIRATRRGVKVEQVIEDMLDDDAGSDAMLTR